MASEDRGDFRRMTPEEHDAIRGAARELRREVLARRAKMFGGQVPPNPRVLRLEPGEYVVRRAAIEEVARRLNGEA